MKHRFTIVAFAEGGHFKKRKVEVERPISLVIEDLNDLDPELQFQIQKRLD